MRLLFVEWDDAAGAPDKLGSTWETLKDIRAHVTLERIKSVGWLVKEDAREIVLVPNVSADKYGDAPTAIPKATIVRRLTLKEPPA